MSTFGCIPVTILKDSIDVYLAHLTNSVNHSLQTSVFPRKLREAEVIPLYKKLDPLSKENYRPVSLLPHLSKVFERIIYKQINSYMEDKFAKCLTGFRKSHGTQHALLTMLEKWKKGIDNGSYVSALFMDLSKAFGTINHGLMLAKLKAHGFSTNALNLMHSYLKNKKQKVQINNKFSLERNVIAGVPQGSIDGPLLFNLFINDLVFFIQYSVLSNYVDDNNLFVIGKNKEDIKSLLLLDFEIVNNWFYENFMILNPEKSHYMCLVKNLDDNEVLNFNNLIIERSKEVEILGIKIDKNLNFNNHIKSICRKAGQKLSALLRISSNLNMKQEKLLYKSTIKSQFNYFPSFWMFCSRQSNTLINKIHERSLRISYKDQKTSDHNLLGAHNELTIHQRNLNILITEIYKIVNGVAPLIMNSLFELRRNEYNIRNFQVLSTDFRKTVNYGIETITYRAPSIWAKLPSEYKLAAFLDEFKVKIKKWICDTCPCRLCKKFQPNLGLLIRNMISKKCEFALFYYIFKKKIKNDITHQKITKQLLKMFLINQKYFM